MGRRPVFVDLDVGQGSISLPGKYILREKNQQNLDISCFISLDKCFPKTDIWQNSTKFIKLCEIDCSFTGTIAGTIVDQPVKAEELFDQSAPLGKKHASNR